MRPSSSALASVLHSVYYIAASCVAVSILSCATIPTEAEMRARDAVSIDPTNPKRIRFIVNGDPGLAKYPDIQAMSLSVHEKIKEGMRRHAADILAERGWCPKGFDGPEIVWAHERARLTKHFFVDCKV